MAAITEAPASTITEPETAGTPERISETEAARQLGVVASTLRLWRTKGKLADGLVTETPSPLPGGRPKVTYDAAWVADYAENGEANRSIFPDADTDD